MIHQKKICIAHVFLVFFLLVVFVPAKGSAIEITPEEVSRIAEEGKEPFLATIALEYQNVFGNSEVPKHSEFTLEDALNPTSDVHANLKKNPVIILGEPFQVYTIATDAIMNYNSAISLSSIVIPTTKWFVPVLFHNKPRAILTIDFTNGGWEVVSIGMGDISEKVNKTLKMDIKGKNRTNKFVRIYPALSDFILAETQGKEKILPFSYTVTALNIDNTHADASGLHEVSDIMPKLISRVQNNVGQ